MIDKWNIEQILLNISNELNIQLGVIDRPNCSELILRSLLSVNDVPFGLSKGVTFGATILIISMLEKTIEKYQLNKKKFEQAIGDNLETLRKLSISVKGVIYLYTGYEDN